MPDMTVSKYVKAFTSVLADPDPKFDKYREFATQIENDPKYKNGISANDFALMLQAQFPKSDVHITDLKVPSAPSAGGGDYLSALKRGFHEGSQALDVAYANLAGLGSAGLEGISRLPVPGMQRVAPEQDPLRTGEKYLRGLAQREGARAQAIPESRGVGPNIAEAIPETAGSLVPALIGAEAGGLPGMATAAGVQSAEQGPLPAGAAMLATEMVGKTVPGVERRAAKIIGEPAARWAVPAAYGAAAGGGSYLRGASPEKALAQGLVTGGMAATQTSRGEPKAKTTETAAPKGESPPAAREPGQIDRTDWPADVRSLPKEQLEGAYRAAYHKTQELQPRMDLADTALSEARARLKSYEAEKDKLDFSPTPTSTKESTRIDKDIAEQKDHIKKLEERHRVLSAEYRRWSSAFGEARDRAQFEKAPWYYAQPPAVREEVGAPQQKALVRQQPTEVAKQQPPINVPPQYGAEQSGPIRQPGTVLAGELAAAPVARAPYRQPGQPQARVGAGQEPAQLPPGTQPFEMMGAQPPMPRGRRIEAGEPTSVREAIAEKPKASVEKRGAYVGKLAPKKAAEPPKARVAKTAEPPKARREAKAATKAAEPRSLTAGTHYVVKDTNPDLGLYKGETVIYRGPYGGKYGFDVIDPDTGQKSLMQIEASTPMKDILDNLEEPGEKKKRPGDKHLGDSPQAVKAKAEEQPSILGEIKNKIGEWLGPNVPREEATGEKVPQGEGDYSVAYSRATRRPIIMAHSKEEMDKLAGGDYGATFLKPGDVGVGGGPLAQVVRKSLREGPVSVVGPDVAAPMEPATPGKMQGTVQHEVIHQMLGETKVPTEKFLSALPPDIAEPMRAHLTKNFPKSKWGEEIPAHLGASGVVAPGSDPRVNQAETIGLSPEQAQKAWKVYLSLLAKQDPKKAAKLKAHMGADTDATPPASRK